MSDSNVDLESNGNKETSFDCWSESTDKVFTSSGDGVQDVFCPSENPKMHQTDDSSRCFGFHGCSFRCQWYQHRQVCNLRLPLLPQLEMECFLCHILWWCWSILKTSHLNYFLFVKIMLRQSSSHLERKAQFWSDFYVAFFVVLHCAVGSLVRSVPPNQTSSSEFSGWKCSAMWLYNNVWH